MMNSMIVVAYYDFDNLNFDIDDCSDNKIDRNSMMNSMVMTRKNIIIDIFYKNQMLLFFFKEQEQSKAYSIDEQFTEHLTDLSEFVQYFKQITLPM